MKKQEENLILSDNQFKIINICELETYNINNFFDPDEPDYTEKFFKTVAKEENEKNISRTHVLVDLENKRIAGFFTLSLGHLNFKIVQDNQGKYEASQDSCLMLKMLAVDSDYQRQGIGSLLISEVINIALELLKNIGFKYISLDALEDSRTFYKKMGFKYVNPKSEISKDIFVKMYFDINDAV